MILTNSMVSIIGLEKSYADQFGYVFVTQVNDCRKEKKCNKTQIHPKPLNLPHFLSPIKMPHRLIIRMLNFKKKIKIIKKMTPILMMRREHY